MLSTRSPRKRQQTQFLCARLAVTVVIMMKVLVAVTAVIVTKGLTGSTQPASALSPFESCPFLCRISWSPYSGSGGGCCYSSLVLEMKKWRASVSTAQCRPGVDTRVIRPQNHVFLTAILVFAELETVNLERWPVGLPLIYCNLTIPRPGRPVFWVLVLPHAGQTLSACVHSSVDKQELSALLTLRASAG